MKPVGWVDQSNPTKLLIIQSLIDQLVRKKIDFANLDY
jgi:hypothetical protein